MIWNVQILLWNVTKMTPEAQHAPHPCMAQPSVYPLHKVCSPSSSGAWSGSAWQQASGWHWPTARPCVWSGASSSGTPPVVTSHGKARRSRSGILPVQTQIQAIILWYFVTKRCTWNARLSCLFKYRKNPAFFSGLYTFIPKSYQEPWKCVKM